LRAIFYQEVGELAVSPGNGQNSADRVSDQAADAADQSRRDAVLRFAKYTAPAMLAMLLNDKAMAASPPPP
jgi:hypothetical protein